MSYYHDKLTTNRFWWLSGQLSYLSHAYLLTGHLFHKSGLVSDDFNKQTLSIYSSPYVYFCCSKIKFTSLASTLFKMGTIFDSIKLNLCWESVFYLRFTKGLITKIVKIRFHWHFQFKHNSSSLKVYIEQHKKKIWHSVIWYNIASYIPNISWNF